MGDRRREIEDRRPEMGDGGPESRGNGALFSGRSLKNSVCRLLDSNRTASSRGLEALCRPFLQ